MSNESSAYKLLDKSEFLGHYQYIQNCASWLSDKELLISFKSNVVLMILDPYGLQCSDMKCPHFERNFSFEKLPYRSLRSRVDKISLIGADWHEYMTSTDDDETLMRKESLYDPATSCWNSFIISAVFPDNCGPNFQKLIAVLSLDGQIVIFDPYTGLTEYGIFLHTPKLLKYYLTNKIMFHETYLDSMKQERIPTIDIFVNESLNMYNVSKLLAVSTWHWTTLKYRNFRIVFSVQRSGHIIFWRQRFHSKKSVDFRILKVKVLSDDKTILGRFWVNRDENSGMLFFVNSDDQLMYSMVKAYKSFQMRRPRQVQHDFGTSLVLNIVACFISKASCHEEFEVFALYVSHTDSVSCLHLDPNRNFEVCHSSRITLAGESLYAYTHCSVLKIRLSEGKIITDNSVAEVVKLTERNFGMAASKNEVLLAYNSKKRIAYKSSLLSPKLYIGILKEISPRDCLQKLLNSPNLRDSTDLLIVMRQLLLCKKIPGTVWKWMIKRMNEMKIQWSHSLKILRFCCVVMTQRKIISMQYVKCWENVIKKIDFILTLCYAIQLYRKLKLLLPSENPEIMDMAVQVKEFLKVYEKKPKKRKLPTRRRRKVRRLAKSAFSTSFCEICNKNYKTWIPRIGRVCEDGHLINFCNITFQCLPTSACLHCIRCGAIASTAIKSPAMIELFGDTVCPYCDGTFITTSIS
ncbi:hypothetical protein T01_8843 [Trichinella spiralis]|uniref:General transcription factor 3C polypeptide 4 n=1 Tax=Trichinella spiralis TaxID=6334 RepID=A0A0V1BPI6_TRISP|nr:hypothetical protein T01_8843 [Trichinella spiralis]